MQVAMTTDLNQGTGQLILNTLHFKQLIETVKHTLLYGNVTPCQGTQQSERLTQDQGKASVLLLCTGTHTQRRMRPALRV